MSGAISPYYFLLLSVNSRSSQNKKFDFFLMNDKSPLTHFAGGGDQNHPQEKEMQKGKTVV